MVAVTQKHILSASERFLQPVTYARMVQIYFKKICNNFACFAVLYMGSKNAYKGRKVQT